MNESNRASTQSLPQNSREAEFYVLASESEKYAEQRRSLLFRLMFAAGLLLFINVLLVLNDDSWLSVAYASWTRLAHWFGCFWYHVKPEKAGDETGTINHDISEYAAQDNRLATRQQHSGEEMAKSARVEEHCQIFSKDEYQPESPFHSSSGCFSKQVISNTL
jgi:hypothetical protein